jgi:hypothetical protein
VSGGDAAVSDELLVGPVVSGAAGVPGVLLLAALLVEDVWLSSPHAAARRRTGRPSPIVDLSKVRLRSMVTPCAQRG